MLVRCDYDSCIYKFEDIQWPHTGYSRELNRMVYFCNAHHAQAEKFPKSIDEALYNEQLQSFDTGSNVVTNEQGGKQSAIITSLYKLDPDVILALGAVLGYGAHKYDDEGIAIGSENWRKIPHTDHLDHMLEHIFMYMRELKREQLGLGPDLNDEDRGLHMDHIVCRAMFAHATKDSYHEETMKAAQKKP